MGDPRETPLERTARILDAVAAAPDGLTVSRMAGLVGLPQPTTYRLVQRLVGIGYLEEVGSTRLFRLGRRLVALARSSGAATETDRVVRVLLQQLADETGMTAFVAFVSGRRIVVVEACPPATAVGPSVRDGSVYPTHATASGRAILAFRPQDEIDAFLKDAPFAGFSPSTLTGADAFRTALRDVRDAGYATMKDELATGTWAIASPVPADGPPSFSLGLVTLASLLPASGAKAGRLAPALRQRAADIAGLLTAPAPAHTPARERKFG